MPEPNLSPGVGEIVKWYVARQWIIVHANEWRYEQVTY